MIKDHKCEIRQKKNDWQWLGEKMDQNFYMALLLSLHGLLLSEYYLWDIDLLSLGYFYDRNYRK